MDVDIRSSLGQMVKDQERQDSIGNLHDETASVSCSPINISFGRTRKKERGSNREIEYIFRQRKRKRNHELEQPPVKHAKRPGLRALGPAQRRVWERKSTRSPQEAKSWLSREKKTGDKKRKVI